MKDKGVYRPIMGGLVNGSKLAPKTIISTWNASGKAPALLSGKQWSVITRSSYSSSTSRSSRRLRRWWGSLPFCGVLGGHWQLLPDEPGSVSYASPPAPSPWTVRRKTTVRAGWGGVYRKIITALAWNIITHTQTSHDPRNHMRLKIWQQECRPKKAGRREWTKPYILINQSQCIL